MGLGSSLAAALPSPWAAMGFSAMQALPLVPGLVTGPGAQIQARENLCEQTNAALGNLERVVKVGAIAESNNIALDELGPELQKWSVAMRMQTENVSNMKKNFVIQFVVEMIVLIAASCVLIYHLFKRKDTRVGVVANLNTRINALETPVR